MILSQPTSDGVDDISVNFSSVSLSNTSWTIQELSLFVKESHLEKVKIFIEQNCTSHKYAKEVRIVNSTFGHMNIRGAFNIHVTDCAVDGSTVTSDSTLLDVVGGSLSVSNSSFQHLTGGVSEGPGLLRAVGCSIHVLGVNCSNNEAPGGLIQIQNESELLVQNSTFINNGDVSSPSSVISITFNSSLFISDSLFSGNAASSGSCILLHHNVSVTISQSTFVNNRADYGGVIYQNYKTALLKQNTTKPTAEHVQSDVSANERRGDSFSSFCSVYESHFVENWAVINGGVAHLEGTFTDVFASKSAFIGNGAKSEGGVIYTKNLTGTVVLEQCRFSKNSAGSSGDCLFLIGTHSQLMSCGFFGNSNFSHLTFVPSTVDFEYGTSSINNCTFSEQAPSSIGAYGTKLIVTDSRCYGLKIYCLNWGNSEVAIIGSEFAAFAEIFLFTINWSNLTVIDSSFTNGRLVFQSHVGTDRVEFINCSFYTLSGFVLIGQTVFKNCTISNLKEQLIWAIHSKQLGNPPFEDRTGSAQLDIVDSVIIGNSVSADKPFIYIGNVSFTMKSCLYTGNDVTNHMMLNVTTDVTMTNVTFFNNSFGGQNERVKEKSLLTVKKTVIEIYNCTFYSNNMQDAPLMLVLGGVVRVMNTVMMDNYNTDYTEKRMISIHDSETVEFSSSKFLNNSNVDIFGVWSSTYLLIESCSFENNFGDEFDIWHTYDVILQRSTFYKPNIGAISTLHDVNNLRIFRCTFTFYRELFWSYGDVRTKLFRLGSDFKHEAIKAGTATVNDFFVHFIFVQGSPYASGWY